MAAADKPGRRVTEPPSPPRQAPEPPRELPPVVEAVVASARDAILEKRPYLKFAFANPYNLSLFGGALAAAGLTMNPLLAVVAIGPRRCGCCTRRSPRGSGTCSGIRGSRRSGTRWNARTRGAHGGARAGGSRARGAPGRAEAAHPAARRAEPLVHRRSAARRTRQDRSLVEAFLDMAVTCARYEQYLESIDIAASTRTATDGTGRSAPARTAIPRRRSRRRTSPSS